MRTVKALWLFCYALSRRAFGYAYPRLVSFGVMTLRMLRRQPALMRKKWQRMRRAYLAKELNPYGRVLVPLWIAIGERRGIASLLIMSIVGTNLFLLVPSAEAATYTWVQTDWSGGADGGTYPTHASNQTGWTKYDSKDSAMTATTSLAIATTSGAATQTTDTDFNAGTFTSQTEVTGSGASAGVQPSSSSFMPSDTWDPTASTVSGNQTSGSAMTRGPTGIVYFLSASNAFQKFTNTSGENRWVTLTNPPNASDTGGDMVWDGSNFVYLTTTGSPAGLRRYSISGNSWSTLASSTAGIHSIAYYDGYVYAVRGSSTDDFDRYDVNTDTWEQMADMPAVSISGSTGLVSADNGYLYSGIGSSLGGNATFRRYNTADDTWSTMTSAPGDLDNQTSGTGGGDSGLAWTGGDYIYAAGAGTGGPFFRYSISGDSWTTLTSSGLSFQRTGAALVYTGGGVLFAIRGGTIAGPLLRYSIADDEWGLTAVSAALAGSLSLPTGLDSVGAAGVFVSTDDGNLYAHHGTAIVSNSPSNFFQYSTSARTWTAMATSSNTNSFSRLAYPGSGDSIYMLSATSSTARADMWGYSISGNSWAALSSTTVAVGSGVTVEAGGGDDLYVTVGSNKDFWRYSTSTNSWSAMASSTSASNFGSGAALKWNGGDHIYTVVGGGTAFQRYSILGNSWTALTAIPVAFGSGATLGYTPEAPDYIWAVPASSGAYYRYSISGNSWTQVATSSAAEQFNSLVYPGSGDFLYKLSNTRLNLYAFTGSSFVAPGEFRSSAMDLGQASAPSTFAFATSPVSSSIQFQLRSADTSGGISGATFLGPTGSGDYYETSTTTINSSHSGDRWFQYRSVFNDEGETLESATINYEYYQATTTATSSAFNSGDAANVPASISWEETTPAGTDVKFQVRTAPNNSGSPGTFTAWMGPDGTANTYFTDSEGGEDIPAALTDGSNDQWMQYRVFLTGDGTATPQVHEVTMTYVVNAPPEFNPNYPSAAAGGASATQGSDGVVTINYSVRDPDTDLGSLTPGEITPSFEYSLDNGSTWASVTAGLAAGGTSTKAVDDSSYTVHTASWTARTQITGTYDTDAKIRVTVDDNEAANNTAQATSAAFTLDVKAPTGTSVIVDASETPADITLAATDDTALEMKVGTASDLSGSSFEAFNVSKTLSLTEGQTVYAQFRDAFGNTSAILSAEPPDTPQDLFYADISNPGGDLYQEFIAWGVVSSPSGGFAQYNVLRSTNGGAYSSIATISDRLTNYYADFNLNSANTYSYKISAQSTTGNISFFSDATPADAPDGTGSSAISLPVISSVASSAVTPTTATITWTTNELANSTVYYEATGVWPGASSGSYDQTASVPSMVTSHSVTLSGLTPNTQYFFMVKSEDPLEQASTSASTLFTFTTQAGTEISNVTVAQTFDTSAVITWNTNTAADSTVTYDTDTDFSGPQVASDPADTTAHSVTLTGLTSGQTYYFYVSSESGGNTTSDKNVVNGTAQYYSLNTSQDSTAPSISSVTAALVSDVGATITWSTNEPARSQVEWGTSVSLGTLTASTSVFSASHSVTITGLDPDTQYFYRVISADHGGNTTSDTNSGAMYTFTTSAEPGDVIIQSSGGGGGSSGRDTSAPVISEVKVDAVSGNAAYISFLTSEPANEVIRYGKDLSYPLSGGDAAVYRTTHAVTLSELEPLTAYNFRVQATDVAGNIRDSENFTFTTLEAGAALETVEEEETTVQTPASRRASLFAIIDDIIAAISAVEIPEEALMASVSELLSRAVDAPVVSGTDLTVETTATTATVRWTTDRKTNSLVAYAESVEYDPSRADPYTITAGSPTESVTVHTVKLENLTPATTYHFRVRSESAAGAAGLSQDSTFTTKDVVPTISNARFETLTEDEAILKFETDIPTRTRFTLVNAETGESSVEEDESFIREHERRFTNLGVSTQYTLRIVATDGEGNSSDTFTLPFSTVISGEPPVISGVRITTSLIPGRIETAQTIISWKTDKPATSRVLFGEGGGSELKQSTALNATLTRDHVVITTAMKPGMVYKVRVESGDTSGNTVQSEPYTVLTAKPSASVVDLIFDGLGQTFGFLRR